MAFSDFSPRKNIDGVLSAYQLFRNTSKKDIKLIVVSSTNYPKSQILAKARSLEIEDSVSVMVGVSTSTLVRLYSESVCLLYPSFYEGFGLPMLEAMWCGCPVVTSNYGSMKEVSGDAAILINPRSPASIAKGMLQVITNSRLKKLLIKRGIKRSLDFSWEGYAKKLLLIYYEV